MTAPIVSLTPKKGDPEFAQILREYADQVERGEITEYSFVARHVDHGHLMRAATFEDRWRLIAALEYAKVNVAVSG